MEIKCNQEKNKIIIAVIGRVDSVTAAEFEKKITEILHKERTIILDCDGLEYISSAGLRALLLIAKSAERLSTRVCLTRLTPLVQEVLEISGFDSFFEVSNELE